MENYLRRPGGKGNLYDGRIFSDEELRLLSSEIRRIYDNIINRDYSITALRQYDFDNIVKIVDEVAKSLRTQGEYINDLYAETKMNAFGVKIINDIISKRNGIVEKKSWDKFKDQSHLENLNESIEFLINNGKKCFIAGWTIEQVNKVIKEQAKKIKETIDRDIVAMPAYIAKYQEAQSRYMKAKYEWEKKSRLGQFIARLTGKDKEYEEARRQATPYNSIRATKINTPTIKQNGSYVDATRVEDFNNEYLFVAPSIPINYENVEIETTRRSR